MSDTEYIQEIVKEIKKNNYRHIVELGTRTGLSALMIKKQCPNVFITTYDNIYDEETAKLLEEQDIKYVIGDVRTIKHNHSKIDLLFCDTLHTGKQLIDEYNNFYHALHDKSVVVVDDVFLNDKANGFALLGCYSYVLGNPVRSSGLGFARAIQWQKVNYVLGESIPPFMANIWERYNRVKNRLKL